MRKEVAILSSILAGELQGERFKILEPQAKIIS